MAPDLVLKQAKQLKLSSKFEFEADLHSALHEHFRSIKPTYELITLTILASIPVPY